ncbi:hypothetical protein [Streptomyces sp. NPDC058401]|uniref:hypothetical protein n=1 Tax=Streptomyces sp. NPDC058401 TaxID=3346480 RepID=UPI00365CF817
MADQPTGSEDQSHAAAEEGVQQIPAQIQVQVQVVQPPAATEARDALLAAIGAEAQHVVEKSAGQASAALAELARAYAVIVSVGNASATAGLAATGRIAGGLKQISYDGDTIVGVNDADEVWLANKS